jgi:hypothetical protein
MGEFKINFLLVEDNPDEVKAILRDLDVLIVRCEAMYTDTNLHYVGISPKFRVVKMGNKIPEYILNVTKDAGGVIQVTVQEVGK